MPQPDRTRAGPGGRPARRLLGALAQPLSLRGEAQGSACGLDSARPRDLGEQSRGGDQ